MNVNYGVWQEIMEDASVRVEGRTLLRKKAGIACKERAKGADERS